MDARGLVDGASAVMAAYRSSGMGIELVWRSVATSGRELAAGLVGVIIHTGCGPLNPSGCPRAPF